MKSKTQLPVIILRGIVLLPNNDLRLEFENDISKNIIDESELFHDSKVLIVNKEDTLEETVSTNDLPNIGVISSISHRIELPNGKTRIIITGIKRVNVDKYLDIKDNNSILEAVISNISYKKIDYNEEVIIIKKLKRELEFYTKAIPYVSNGILSQIEKVKSLNTITDIVVPYLNLDKERMIEYLKESDPVERSTMILQDIYNETDAYNIELQIDNRVRRNIDDNQRKFILQEKLKEVKKELGDKSLKDTKIIEYKNKIKKLKLDSKLVERLDEEIKRLESMTDLSPEVSVVENYLDWVLSIPWNKYTKDNEDLNNIYEKLDESHSGLQELKDRFVEYVAVRKKSNSVKSPIICLVGPPGVGKTSFVRSLANALNRNFVKISVGGVNDEAEIMGHRRTYLGAKPGRIIQSLKKAKSMNPVFLIDEIDKMTKDQKGDPASSLLEVLDPEQNKYFSDNYIEEEVDLKDVMFITTANYIENIPEPLKDRMEIIELSAYTEFEKLDIFKKYILPNTLKEHGLNEKTISISDDLMLSIISNYTNEAGVRELSRVIEKLVRKIITDLMKKKLSVNKITVDKDMIKKYLGLPKYEDNSIKNNEIGVVNGLAYTQLGGDVLNIEVNYMPGSGKLKLTGQLGDVMQESANIAFSYVKSNYKLFNIDPKLFRNYDFHIHVPEGAVKKDGPSAGITLTTALISSLTHSYVDSKLAMTGEITLRGNILKIGGLKNKTIAALKYGINKVIIPKSNLNDIEELPKEVRDNIKFIPVDNYIEAFKIMRRGFYE